MANNCDQCEKARQPPTEVFTTGGAQFACTKNEVREEQDLPVTSNWQDGTRGGGTVFLVFGYLVHPSVDGDLQFL